MKVAHIGLVVADTEKSGDFYCRHLGCKRVDEREEAGLKIICLQNGPVIIELLQYLNQPAVKRESGVIDHLAFLVDDLDEWAVRLQSRGVSLEPGSPRTTAGGGKILFFAGPDGERIELVGPVQG